LILFPNILVGESLCTVASLQPGPNRPLAASRASGFIIVDAWRQVKQRNTKVWEKKEVSMKHDGRYCGGRRILTRW